MATGVFGKRGRSVGPEGEIWRTDLSTLRDVVLDREAMTARLGEYPSLERVWALSLLDRGQQAVSEGRALLTNSTDRFRPLLVLAHAYQRQYQWHEAARMQEDALRLARSPAREALVRYEIGRRLFDEALYRDAAAELEWAHDLYRTTVRERLARVCDQALKRAREVLLTNGIAPNDPSNQTG
ncbi:hypothetical protein J7I92_22845 [Arthrobacter sp. ISL-72]|nr:hypothetical protein [Arthrobacter sp. ISL-72]